MEEEKEGGERGKEGKRSEGVKEQRRVEAREYLILYCLLSQVQYVFIHDTLNEIIACGETELSAANIRIAIGKLSRNFDLNNTTGFQAQYEVCTSK